MQTALVERYIQKANFAESACVEDIAYCAGRKLRERAPVGNVFFYEPASEQNRYKHEVLKMKGFNVETLDYKINDDYKPFNEFYYAAINDIKSKIE